MTLTGTCSSTFFCHRFLSGCCWKRLEPGNKPVVDEPQHPRGACCDYGTSVSQAHPIPSDPARPQQHQATVGASIFYMIYSWMICSCWSNHYFCDRFFDATGFPGVIGAIDCTHISIVRPVEREDAYINRKGNPTINVQAVCAILVQ